jgi:hypothetical protein
LTQKKTKKKKEERKKELDRFRRAEKERMPSRTELPFSHDLLASQALQEVDPPFWS